MKLTVQLKLQPTPSQADALRRTLETATAACAYISQVTVPGDNDGFLARMSTLTT